MNLYKFTSGAYSDYSERWFQHERKMTKSELKSHLLEHIPAIRAYCEAQERLKKAEAMEKFGVPANKVRYEYRPDHVRKCNVKTVLTPRGTVEEIDTFRTKWCNAPHARDLLLKAAGFVEVEALVTFDEGDRRNWEGQLADFERECNS